MKIVYLPYLFLQFGPKDGCGVLTESINPTGYAALISQVSANPPLILGSGPANEGTVEDKSVLGSVSPGLKSPKQSLLCSKDLNCAGRSFSQVGQRSGMRDESCSDNIPNKGGEVWGDQAHLGLEIGGQLLPVVGETDHATGECVDVQKVDGRDVHAHGALAGVNDRLGPRAVHQDLLELLKVSLLGDLLPVFYQLDYPGVECVLWDNLDELWEVVGVPFSYPHGKGVHVFVQLVQKGDGLDDHVVRLVYIELDLGSGVAVRQTELGLVGGHGGETLDQFWEVMSYASDDLWHDPDVRTLDVARVIDTSGELGVRHAQDDTLTLLNRKRLYANVDLANI